MKESSQFESSSSSSITLIYEECEYLQCHLTCTRMADNLFREKGILVGCNLRFMCFLVFICPQVRPSTVIPFEIPQTALIPTAIPQYIGFIIAALLHLLSDQFFSASLTGVPRQYLYFSTLSTLFLNWCLSLQITCPDISPLIDDPSMSSQLSSCLLSPFLECLSAMCREHYINSVH